MMVSAPYERKNGKPMKIAVLAVKARISKSILPTYGRFSRARSHIINPPCDTRREKVRALYSAVSGLLAVISRAQPQFPSHHMESCDQHTESHDQHTSERLTRRLFPLHALSIHLPQSRGYPMLNNALPRRYGWNCMDRGRV